MTPSRRGGLAWCGVAAVAVLHHDYWLWTDRSLLWGFLPIGLGWQALVSILAAAAWFAVVHAAWPRALEEWADRSEVGDDRP